jgi:hypothetical protein
VLQDIVDARNGVAEMRRVARAGRRGVRLRVGFRERNAAAPGGLGRQTRDRRRTCPLIGRRPPTPLLTPGRARRALAFNRPRGGGSRQRSPPERTTRI